MHSPWALIFDIWVYLLWWAMGLTAAFYLLSKWMPCNPAQPVIRKDVVTDLLYFFVMPIVNRVARAVMMGFGIAVVFRGQSPETISQYLQNGFGPLGALPIWLQAAIIFIVSDFILYWIHRGFHGKSMWKFHAIHHSSPEVDWISAYRFHPINIWLSFIFVDVLMMFIGFSPAAVASMAVVNMIYSAMVHANLNWTFGPFKYLFASPVFHRWHHTTQKEGMDKNFAPTFPLLDVMFGTFYMPEGRLPERYGVSGSNIPSDFIGQMVWPFKK